MLGAKRCVMRRSLGFRTRMLTSDSWMMMVAQLEFRGLGEVTKGSVISASLVSSLMIQFGRRQSMVMHALLELGPVI